MAAEADLEQHLQPIASHRLEIDPATRLCIACAQAAEKR